MAETTFLSTGLIRSRKSKRLVITAEDQVVIMY